MKFFRDQNTGTTKNQASDRVAKGIANSILYIQRRLAATGNRWFNGFSASQQKWILCLAVAAIAAWLLIGLSSDYKAFSVNSRLPFPATHIGQPSEQPKQKNAKKQFTDSLTVK